MKQSACGAGARGAKRARRGGPAQPHEVRIQHRQLVQNDRAGPADRSCLASRRRRFIRARARSLAARLSWHRSPHAMHDSRACGFLHLALIADACSRPDCGDPRYVSALPGGGRLRLPLRLRSPSSVAHPSTRSTRWPRAQRRPTAPMSGTRKRTHDASIEGSKTRVMGGAESQEHEPQATGVLTTRTALHTTKPCVARQRPRQRAAWQIAAASWLH